MFVASADVAQSVEHLIGNEEVGSSNLLISSKTDKRHPEKGAVFLFSGRWEYATFYLTKEPILVMGA